MTRRRFLTWSSLLTQVAGGAIVLYWTAPATSMSAAAAIVAVACGLALFAFLAHGLPAGRPGPPNAVGIALAAIVVVAAFAEELLWRVGLLSHAARVVPVPFAFLGSTLLFAAAHWRAQGPKSVGVHTVTGATFGAVYLAAGLVAAATAHAVYNLLVVGARRRARTSQPSLATTWAYAPAVAEVVSAARVAAATGVTKGFGDAVVLEGVDLEVGRGEILCLLGPNGAGKSTLVSLLVGLRRPDAGRVALFGQSPRSTAARRRLGVTPQEDGYPQTLRVTEVAELAAAHYTSPYPVPELLDRFGLEPLARRQVGGLSGGERRRLAVALAFAGRPDLVVLDEPTVGLDVEARHAVWREVRAYARAGGSVLFTTHYLEEAETIATRIVLLDGGRIAAEGTVPEVRARIGLTRIVVVSQPLPPLPGVVHADESGGRRTLLVRDPEAVVRALVEGDVDLGSLEVRPLGLEEVILSLTQERQS